jgi:hypothetical protein
MAKYVLALLLCSATAVAATTPGAPEAKANAGRAVTMIGRVLVRNEGEPNAPVRELKVGDSVHPGDIVNTRSDATAKLIMIDKSIVDLGASTLFKVDEWVSNNITDRKVALTLGYGKIRASVSTPVGPKGKFTIKTKAATMGVRGTEFIVSSDVTETGGSEKDGKPITTQVTVVHGKVEVFDQVGGGKPIEVTTGKQLTTNGLIIGENVQRSTANATGPKLVDLTPQELKTLIAGIKMQDQTFAQAVVIDTSNKNQPSLGTSTLTAIMGNAPVLPASGPKPGGDIGLPGTFPTGAPPTTPPVPQGLPVTLAVTYVRH